MADLPVTFLELLVATVLIEKGARAVGAAVSSNQAGGGLPAVGSAASTQVLAHPSAAGYVNPFAAIKTPLTRERLDMGWDFHTGGAGDPIVSLGDAVVTAIVPGWWQGQPLIMTQLTSGPEAGKLVYYAEGLTPQVSIGQKVKAGQQIAVTTDQPTGLEFGWGGTKTGLTLQQLIAPSIGDAHAAAADSFHSFLTALGV